MGGHGAAAVDKDLLGHGHYRYGRYCGVKYIGIPPVGRLAR